MGTGFAPARAHGNAQ
jgi:hypothetical protein